MQDRTVKVGTYYLLYYDSCLCVMSELGQPVKFEWHITKVCSHNQLYILLIITRRMTTQRPFFIPTICRQCVNEITLTVN